MRPRHFPTVHPNARRAGLAMVAVIVASGAWTTGGTSAAPTAPAAVSPAPASSPSVVGLSRGSQGPGVVAVQNKLISFGYVLSSGADGVFGASTETALRHFQRSSGLNPSGVVTETTARYMGLAGGVTTTAPAPTAPAAMTPAATASAAGLRRGNSGTAVRQLQTAILRTGLYLSGGVDGVFGPATEHAVSLVQQVNGLSQTGVVDAATARVLGLTTSSPTTPTTTPTTPAPSGYVGLKVGSVGPAVRAVQHALMNTGMTLRGGADGVFGQATYNALMGYQRVNGLGQTGVVDAATARLMGLGSPTTPTVPTTPAPSGYVGLKLGSVGPAVREVQQVLLDTGMTLRGGADGVFGQATYHALMGYQRVNGLGQTGVVDAATARLMGLGTPSTPAPTTGGYAQYDERGARVVALQQALIRAGISVPGGADGVFGSGTAGAVGKFQRAHGLTLTGKVNSATAQALGLSAIPAPTQTPAPVTVTYQAVPVAGACWYGNTWQDARGGGRVHLGTDIGAAEGTALHAVVTGRISYVYHDHPGSLSGNALKVQAPDGTYFFYAHLAGFAPGIGVGVPVTAGQLVGYVGHTGDAAISHLHLEIHPRGGAAVNPYPILKAGKGAC